MKIYYLFKSYILVSKDLGEQRNNTNREREREQGYRNEATRVEEKLELEGKGLLDEIQYSRI